MRVSIRSALKFKTFSIELIQVNQFGSGSGFKFAQRLSGARKEKPPAGAGCQTR